jgi:hypothetical protein
VAEERPVGRGPAPARHHDEVISALGPLDDGLLGVVRHEDVGVDPHAHGPADLARLGDDVLADRPRAPSKVPAVTWEMSLEKVRTQISLHRAWRWVFSCL